MKSYIRPACIAVFFFNLAFVIVGAGVPTVDISTVTWFASSLLLIASAIIYAVSAPPKPGVDVWDYQRRLMRVSEQRLPLVPVITRDTLMYYALILEEAAELGNALASSLQGPGGTLGEFRDQLYSFAATMDIQSTSLRRLLKPMSVNFEISIPADLAREILDGTTDLAVVNAGFCLAAGMPGSEAYLEVVTSNLSKVNANTGLIDKDSTGKWIKGIDYKQPDLTRVLDEAHEEAVFGPRGFRSFCK